MKPDWDLLREFLAGSEDAFRELVSRYSDMVYSVCLREVRDAHLAEDAAQAVFIILARKAASLSSNTVIASWLFKTARLTAANAVRMETRRRRHEQEAATMPAPEPDAPNAPGLALLNDALMALGESDRTAVILKYFKGQTASEIGAALQISAEAAKKRVARAVARLQAYFAECGVQLGDSALPALFTAALRPAPEKLGAAAALVALLASHGTMTTTSGLIAKGAMDMMFWAKIKALGVAACVALVATAGVIGTLRVYGGDAPKPPQAAKAPAAEGREAKDEVKATETARFVVTEDPRTISVSGTGTVMAVPDEIVVYLGVETFNEKLAAARDENLTTGAKVVTAFKALGIDEKQIRTTSFSVSVRYKEDQRASKGIDGYLAKLNYSVTLKDMKLLDRVMDAFYESGGNEVHSISRNIKELPRFADEARKKAVQAARQRAELLAAEMGVKVGKPRQITDEGAHTGDHGGGANPFAASSHSAALAHGEEEVNATVSVIFDLLP